MAGELDEIGEAQRHQLPVDRAGAGGAVEAAGTGLVQPAAAGAAAGLAPAKEMRALGAVEMAADGALFVGGERCGRGHGVGLSVGRDMIGGRAVFGSWMARTGSAMTKLGREPSPLVGEGARVSGRVRGCGLAPSSGA
jgi:hypothetical protein